MRIDKKTDKYAVGSKKLLDEHIEKSIKRLYVAALENAELVWGGDSDEYSRYRRIILKSGNETIRKLKKELENYNVERLTHTLIISANNEEG